MADIDDLFGSDSDDDAPAPTAAPTQKKFDVDDLFGSDDSDDDEPSVKTAPSRLKKSGTKGPKQKKGDGGKRPANGGKKRRREEAAGADTSTAYDSGDDAQATAADDGFLASDDDLEDVRKEYEEERQDFNDEHDGEFDSRPDEDADGFRGGGKGIASKRSAPSEKVSSTSTNLIDKAILASRKKKNKDMTPEDKQVVVTSLLEKMDSAWRRDMDALSSHPPRPAMHKLALVEKVERLLSQNALHETLLDFNVLENIRNWLSPWPSEDPTTGKAVPLNKRTLPNLTLRGKLYTCLAHMPIRPENLKNSERGGDGDRPGLGKVVVMLLQHPHETPRHKRQLKTILEEWSRHIFNKTRDFKQLPQTLRESSFSSKHAQGPAGPASSANKRFGGPASDRQPHLARSMSSEAVDDYLDQELEAVDDSRTVRPVRVGFDFHVKPSAPVLEAAHQGKRQKKKAELVQRTKEQKRKLAMGSQRGDAPLNRVDL